MAFQGPLFHVSEARSHRTSGKEAPVWNLVINTKGSECVRDKEGREREFVQEAPDFPLALGPRAFGGSLWGGPGATVSSFGPLGRFWKNPTCHLFEWVRPSGFVDTARKGRIVPKFEYLSRGDPLDRAEKSRDRTTLFRGQKVKKGSARPPNRYTLKWEAGRPPYGDERSHDLETRHAPPSWAPHSGPRVWGPWRLLKHFMSGRASRQNRACFRVSPIEFNGRQRDIWKMRKNTFRGPRSGLFRHIAPGLLTQLCVRFGPPGNFWKKSHFQVIWMGSA